MDESSKKTLFSIGEVSQATGISISALRQWERRYGAPFSKKAPSGHRRYPSTEISRLRLVTHALELGLSPREVVALPTDQLQRVLKGRQSDSIDQEHSFEAIQNWDQISLTSALEKHWEDLETIPFLDQWLSPLLKQLGERWRLGEISIAQEHFFSECLETFLAQKWRAIAPEKKAPPYLVAAPESEKHRLGLHMCACTLADRNENILFLGDVTPYSEIIRIAKEAPLKGICLSFSEHYSSTAAKKELLLLRKKLPRAIPLLIGGASATSLRINGIQSFSQFGEFSNWVKSHNKLN